VNGAVALLSTLRANGVDVCFANPGTSEMHFVAALDDVPEFRAVLCLFEGVATGAADGYARMTERPAATLLHLGPGLGNGIANLHNARRARVPLVNVVGDHATYHARYDAPLHSDIESLARPVSGWFRRSARSDDVAGDAADAVHAAYGPPGRVATLALPADASWNELTQVPAQWPTIARTSMAPPPADQVAAARRALAGGHCALFLGGDALRAGPLARAAAIGAATGAPVIAETFARRQDHGAGIFAPDRLIYLSEFAISQLAPFTSIILVGAIEPIGFFAYPTVPSRLLPPGCEIVTLAAPGTDVGLALDALADELGASAAAPVISPNRPALPTGALTPTTLAAAIGALLPEDVVVVDEANTGGVHLLGATAGAPPHTWLSLTGGSIGYGMPAALGAAVGGGGRRVLCLEADGSLMYTNQALWSMAREGLDITVVALSNRSYAILNYELQRVGATSTGEASRRLLDLDDPEISLAGLATALGVPGVRTDTAEEFSAALARSFATPGPTFIEARMGKGFG
jgi:acetolactate synthase I/II/III large subunit